MLQPLSQVTNGNGTLLEQLAAPFDASRSAVLIQNDEIVGIVGEYKLSVQKAFKLPRYSAGFELATDSLSSESRTRYVTQSRFPKVSQDISLRVSAGQQYQPLHDVIYQSLHARQPSAKMNFMLTPLDIYQRSDDAENKQVTFRISIASFDKTMTDKEVSVLLDGVAQAAADRFGAVRV
jgi:phenylalanyl-tRNA synthetase beta chain